MTEKADKLVAATRSLVGSVLLFTAYAKAQDYYGFIEKAVVYRSLDFPYLHYGAMATLVVETVLACALLVGIQLRRLTIPGIAAMLLVFTGLILYAWNRYGIDDCGCLGSLAETPPWLSILKNGIMLVMLAFAWLRLPTVNHSASRLRYLVLGCGLLGIGLWFGAMIHRDW